MDELSHEEQQIQAMKQWWAKYGNYVLVGVIIVLGGYVGTQWLQNQQEQEAVSAADAFAPVEKAFVDQDFTRGKILASEVRSDHPDSPYAVKAALWEAKINIEQDKDLAAAEQNLAWALIRLAGDPQEHVVRIRLARVLVAQGNYEGAMSALRAAAELGEFTAAYAELRGDIAVAKGDVANARSEYETALAALAPGVGDRNTLQMKLDDLPVVSVAIAPSSPAAEASDAAPTAEGDAGEASAAAEADAKPAAAEEAKTEETNTTESTPTAPAADADA